MISRRGSDILLTFVLLISLSLKISGSISAQTEERDGFPGHLAALLVQQGYKVAHNVSDTDLLSVSAVRDQCHLYVAKLSPQGWHRNVIQKIAPPESRVLFLFRGMTYRDQPVLLTRAEYYWGRFLRHAGFDRPLHPVLGVVSSRTCELNHTMIAALTRY